MFSDPFKEIEAQRAVNSVIHEFAKAPHLAAPLEEWLIAIFQLWKLDHGERLPSWFVPRGLLSVGFDFDSAKPYECTPYPVSGYGGLVLHLIDTKFPPMLSAKDKLEVRVLLAGAVLVEAHDTPISANSLGNTLDLYQQYRIEENELVIKAISPLASEGSKFRSGRKKGTGGPVRKEISKLLAKTPLLGNDELWELIKAKPPRGFSVSDNRAGKYIEGPKAGDGMEYRRFCNIASEERKKIAP